MAVVRDAIASSVILSRLKTSAAFLFSFSFSLRRGKIPFCTHGKSPMHTVRKVLAAFDLPLLS